MTKEYLVKLSWNHIPLTATLSVIAESEDEACKMVYGVCGRMSFDQGGNGDMPCPDSVSIIGES
jgi:hypothetical protein